LPKAADYAKIRWLKNKVSFSLIQLIKKVFMREAFPDSHAFFSEVGAWLGLIDKNLNAVTLLIAEQQVARDELIKTRLVELFCQGYQSRAWPLITGYLEQIELLINQLWQSELTVEYPEEKFNERLFFFFMLPYLRQLAHILQPLEIHREERILLRVILALFEALIEDPDHALHVHLARQLKKIIPFSFGKALKDNADRNSIAKEFTFCRVGCSESLEEIEREIKESNRRLRGEHLSSEDVYDIAEQYKTFQLAGLFVRNIFKSLRGTLPKKILLDREVATICQSDILMLLQQIVANPLDMTEDEAKMAELQYGLLTLVLPDRTLYLDVINSFPQDDALRLGRAADFFLRCRWLGHAKRHEALQAWITLFHQDRGIEEHISQSKTRINALLKYVFSPSVHIGAASWQFNLQRLNSYLRKYFALNVSEESKEYLLTLRQIRDEHKQPLLSRIIAILLVGIFHNLQIKRSPRHYNGLLKFIAVNTRYAMTFTLVETVLGLQDDRYCDIIQVEGTTGFNPSLRIEISQPNLAFTMALKEFNQLLSGAGLYALPLLDKFVQVEDYFQRSYLTQGTLHPSESLTTLRNCYKESVFGFDPVTLYDLVFKAEAYLKIFAIDLSPCSWLKDIFFRLSLLQRIDPQATNINVLLRDIRTPAVRIPEIASIKLTLPAFPPPAQQAAGKD